MQTGIDNAALSHIHQPSQPNLVNFTVIDLSLPWVQQNPDLLDLSKPIRASNLKNEVKNRYLDTEFKILEFITTTAQHVEKLCKNPVQFGLNRFETIMPYQYNRVNIKDSPEDTEDYINANYIQGTLPGAVYIATQAPLSNTVAHFWKMVDVGNVSHVFMLCSIKQKDKVQSYHYWPTQEDPDSSLKLLGYKVTLKQEKALCPKLTERTITLHCLNSQKEKNIVQYQLKGWDDNEAPHHESVNALNRLLKMALELTLSKTQMLFHCSAGVGRTGTFLALLNLKAMIHRQFTEAGDGTGETLLDNLELSIFNTVRRLREQRWGMVYRREQYIFIYNYMLQEIEALEKSKTMH